jgi:hypothetical protein
METNKTEAQSTERTEPTPVVTEGGPATQADLKAKQPKDKQHKSPNCKKNKARKEGKHSKKAGKSKKGKEPDSGDEDASGKSEPSDESDTSDSSSDSESESEKDKRKRKAKAKKRKEKAKDKKKTKSGKRSKKEVHTSSGDKASPAVTCQALNSKSLKLTSAKDSPSSDSSSESDSEEEDTEGTEEDPEASMEDQQLELLLQLQQQLQLQQLQDPLQQRLAFQPQQQQMARGGLDGLSNPTFAQAGYPGNAVNARIQNLMMQRQMRNQRVARQPWQPRQARGSRPPVDSYSEEEVDIRRKKDKSKKKRGSKLEFKRVDQLWDNTIHSYKLQDTAEVDEDEYDEYLFNVRRTFDWEGKYKSTLIDIKSKLIKEALNDVMEGVKGVSLVEETPSVDPNLLFLYEQDLKKLSKDLKTKIRKEKMKRKVQKRTDLKIKHIKVLLKYFDKDYAEVKKTLYPMLESGLISFDLLWALYKPNTIAYSSTYGSTTEPRAFRVEYAEKEFSFMKGEWYNIEGKYLEYDGKTWGFGTMDVDVPAFKGARKITSLACYPLKYHKDEAGVRKLLIERGKKFVSLQGVRYMSHEGLAYYKKKRQVIKVNINGRVMVDPAIHRRILPNYQISTVKPKDDDDSDSDDYDSDCCCCDSSDEERERGQGENTPLNPAGDDEPRMKRKLVMDDKKKLHLVEVPVDEDGQEIRKEQLEEVKTITKEADAKDGIQVKEGTDDKKSIPVFADDEYLIASPVVLGFAFAEKLWLEFTVSGIKDIVWNEGAYDSLVLEANTKDIVKALVEAHKFHPSESIDDVIQGKGKGLVAVLHGPPGTGKTLTAEGISELLKCPLYMVSAGELGTDPRTLEAELQKILDIAHAWGAVLLLDEADVFLEKRTIQDIHRNALVSIFLRLLEYFQGILFLTTNRVETFDDAFQSRIHIALRYGELDIKAKRAVFKMFIERVRVQEGVATMPFREEDYTNLAKHNLNGRQIKNTVRTAQALAVNKGEPLAMEHIKRVLDVALAFDRDLKGGTGFQDAMRSYM